MTAKSPATLQHEAVLQLITDNKRGVRADADVVNLCYAAIESLKWLDRNRPVIVEAQRIIRDMPAVAAVLRTWPGAQIDEIIELEPKP